MSDELEKNLGELRGQTQRLCRLVCEQKRQSQKKQKAYVTAGILLILACFVFLTRLTSSVSQLDAETLTQMARLAVERHLPESRENVGTYLKSEAPVVVSGLLRSFIKALPELRRLAVENAETTLVAANAELKTLLLSQMKTALESAKGNIEQAHPELDESERLEKVVAQAADQFTAGIDASMTELYPQYAAEMNRVKVYLEKLQQTDPEKLTQREKNHKEIIETLLRLMVRESEK